MIAHDQGSGSTVDGATDLSPQALREVLQNLRVHQIELEMQNEELLCTQVALANAQARYFDFYDLAPVGYVTVGDKALILNANITTATLLGVNRADLIGKAFPSFMLTSDADRYYLLCQQALTSASAQSCELCIRKPDGDAFWISLQAITATGDDGAAVIRMVLSDITERRQLEQAAKEASEHKFRLVADNTSDGILIVDADRNIEYVSPAYVKQLGYSKAEELGRSPEMIRALIHPQDRDVMFVRLERAIASKTSELLYSYRIQHRLGHYSWREDSVRFQYDEFGIFSGACIVARDITERKKAEEELQTSELRYQRLIEELPVGAVLHGSSSEILHSNAKALELLGLTQDQLLGKTSFDPQWNVIREDGSAFPGSTHPSSQAIATRQPVRNVVMGVFRPTSEDRVWLLVNAHPRIELDSSLQQVVVTFCDITEQKNAEVALREANHNLAQARQQLRELLALNEATLENEKRHIAREVHDELGQILTALRMDLAMAIIRHASREPELLEEFNSMKTQVDRAIQVVRNVATSLRPAALDMGLTTAIQWLCMEFTKHGDVECALHGIDEGFEIDDARAVVIFRIVQEALTNIRKYAQARQVDITLLRRQAELSVEIRDNGIGFDLVAVAQRGTLGLLGMRERVIALDGRVDVTSAPGLGTTISVVIPLEPKVVKEPA
jgi:PAS domain S-box-containing protein